MDATTDRLTPLYCRERARRQRTGLSRIIRWRSTPKGKERNRTFEEASFAGNSCRAERKNEGLRLVERGADDLPGWQRARRVDIRAVGSHRCNFQRLGWLRPNLGMSTVTIRHAIISHVISTPRENTHGACQTTDIPTECGRWLANEPAASCRICVEPAECSNSSLGWRTRQKLQCCE
jgi:hypothetical protein